MNSTAAKFGAASVAAAAALPVLTIASDACEAFNRGLRHLTSMVPESFGTFVSGCGRACDCCGCLRAECPPAFAFGCSVRKLGDTYVIYSSRSNSIVGKADPGFKPLRRDVDWVARVEYAVAHKLAHPYDWPEAKHAEWDLWHGIVYDPDDCS